MRINPAYKALQQLKKSFLNQVQFKKNMQESNYGIIYLAEDKHPLSLENTVYYPQELNHISVYEHYKKNEKNGLSVFHFTWSGFSQENKKNTVVLHCYFDQNGQYLYSQAKKNLENVEIVLSPQEEQLVEQYAIKCSYESIGVLLAWINERKMSLVKAIRRQFDLLEKISAITPIDIPRYIQKAQECINLLQDKDSCSFDGTDIRKAHLDNIINFFSRQNNSQKISMDSKDEPTKKQINNDVIYQEKKSLSPKKDQFADIAIITQKIDTINKQIEILENDSQISSDQKVLKIHALLNEEFNLLIKKRTSKHLDNLLFTVLQKINTCFKSIQDIFETQAEAGNIDALVALKQHITYIDTLFFAKIVRSGSISVCDFMLKEFDECLFFLNFCTFGSLDYMSDPVGQSYTLLHAAYNTDNKELVKLLLQRGANPNFYGALNQSVNSLLHRAISKKDELMVSILLEYGAETNPPINMSIASSETLSNKKLSKKNHHNFFQRNANQSQHNIENRFIPLMSALSTRNLPIITLLLQHQASVFQQNENGFDALGFECCFENRLPDLEIVTALLAYGADINKPQGKDSNLTPLIYACQRNDFKSVESFIQMGANPNQIILNQCILTNEENEVSHVYIPMTAYQKAFIKDHTEIADFLISHRDCRLTFLTVALHIPYIINLQTIEITLQSLDVVYPNKLQEFITYLHTHFNDNDIKSGAKEAANLGSQYFKNKQFHAAANMFYMSLIFGNKENRYGILYNLANALKNSSQIVSALKFFEICKLFDPNSEIGKFSKIQHEKLSNPISKSLEKSKAKTPSLR